MRQSTRLILNTAATFTRMLVSVGIGLVTTRLLLGALGESDFGLYAVVFAAAAFITVVSESLTTGAMTRLAVEIGRADLARLKEVFATSLWMFLALGCMVMLAGTALAWPIVSLLDIPPGSHTRAVWAFLLTVAGFALAIAGIPYRALLQAHQGMVVLAVLDLLDSVLRLGAVLLLGVFGVDKLVLFCGLIGAASLVQTAVAAAVARRGYAEARAGARAFRREHLRRLTTFGWWDMLLTLGWRLRFQGVQLVLNIGFRGTTVNAAFQLAAQLGGLQSNLAAALHRASQPALVSAEGAGDRTVVHRLVLVTSKYMVLAMSLLLAPLLLEPRAVLRLWVGETPEHAPALVQYVSSWICLYWLTVGHQVAIQATGQVRGHAILMFLIDALALGAGALWALGFGGAPWVLPACTLIGTLVMNIARALWAVPLIGLPFGDWVRHTVLPVAVVASAGLAAAYLGAHLPLSDPIRLILVTGTYALVALPVGWVVALAPWEREHFRRIILKGTGASASIVASLRSRL